MKNTPAAAHLISLVALTLMSLAVAGCAHKDTIVGKWQGAVTQSSGTMNSTFDFTPDGKEAIKVVTNVRGMMMNIDVSGTYTVSGTNLTQNMTTMAMSGRSMPIPPHQAQPGPFTLDGDHLTLTNPGTKEPLTLTRVKE